MMSLRYLELFLVDWLIVFEVNPVFVISGQSKAVFVEADGLLMFEQYIDVSLLEFVRYLQVTLSGNLVLGYLGPWSFWDILLDGSADFGCRVISEQNQFVFFDFHESHEVIPLYRNLIGGTVLDHHFAVAVLIDADYHQYPIDCRCSRAMNGGYICFLLMCFSIEFCSHNA